MPAYSYPRYPFRPCEELTGNAGRRHDVVIVGGGPVGLTLALDLAQRGICSVVLQRGDTVSDGSRALCWAKRTLEILDRLGPAEAIAAKGFTWNTGRVFFGADEVYAFDLQPQAGEKFPAFVNLQQYYAEESMLEAVARAGERIDLRWQSRVIDVRQDPVGATATVETPQGRYEIHGRWLVACDGARSTVRRAMGLDFAGRVFEDHFLIADVDAKEEIPWSERRFWFLPGFHRGETALCHRQGEGMWRVDFQLGWDGVDPEAELAPDRAIPRIRAMLGGAEVSVTWLSVYTFQCRRLERFRHGRVLFAGDAAHQVSPFGARGGNSGIQDAENLAWKLALVLRDKAPDALLDSYHDERSYAADENIRITTRTTDFMTAKTPLRARLREAVLTLARKHPFARTLVNSGRLSTPTVHEASPLNSASDGFAGGVPPGAPCPNVRLTDGGDYLLDRLGRGLRFEGLYFCGGAVPPAQARALKALEHADVPLRTYVVDGGADCGFATVPDPDGRLARAFQATQGSYYLIRPDQHVAGRWRRLDLDRLQEALNRALARGRERTTCRTASPASPTSPIPTASTRR